MAEQKQKPLAKGLTDFKNRTVTIIPIDPDLQFLPCEGCRVEPCTGYNKLAGVALIRLGRATDFASAVIDAQQQSDCQFDIIIS